LLLEKIASFWAHADAITKNCVVFSGFESIENYKKSTRVFPKTSIIANHQSAECDDCNRKSLQNGAINGDQMGPNCSQITTMTEVTERAC